VAQSKPLFGWARFFRHHQCSDFKKTFQAFALMDVHFPTEQAGKELVFRRYTQPDKDHQLLLAQLDWHLPDQPPPRLTSNGELMN
jgi:hypothetical protein